MTDAQDGIGLPGVTVQLKGTQTGAITDIDGLPKGALISTRFDSFDSLKKVIHIEYQKGYYPSVVLSHSSNGKMGSD